MSNEYALITADYVTERKKPVVLLFCRDTRTRKRKTIRIKNFKPYMYIQPKHFFLIPQTFRVRKKVSNFRDIFNRAVTRIEVDVPASVRQIRDFFTKNKAPTWEADVLFPLRYLIDCGIFEGVKRLWDGTICNADVPSILRSMYYDIETLAKRGTKVNPRGKEPIICITTYDSFTKEYCTFYWGERVLPTHIKDTKMIKCTTEKEMLTQYLKYVRRIDPDLIVGFFNQRYDDIKVITRMRALNIDPRMLSPEKSIQDRGDEEGFVIKGRECFDLYWAYRILRPKELLEYSLDHVCLIELEEQKTPIYDFESEWYEQPERVIERNQRDVELMVRLNDKLQMIEYFDENRRLVGCRFQDIFKRSRVADVLLLRWCHDNEIALPSKWEQEERKQVGAEVFKPIPGIYEKVLYLDFKAMYPSIVIAFNICPTTYSPYEGTPIDTSRKYFYLKKEQKQGIVPALLQDILTMRWDIQERMKKAKEDGDEDAFTRYYYQQESVKFQANALYGVLKYRSFRMYSLKAAESIALMGRNILNIGKDIIENELGLKVAYGDTDGMFVLADPDIPLEEQSKTVIEYIDKRMNEKLEEIYGVKEAGIQIKVEALVEKLLIPVRKKYAFIDTEGKIKEKGLAKIRSDCSDEAREVQHEIIRMIFDEEAREKILEYCRKRIVRVRSGKVHPFRLAVPKRITKDFDKYKVRTIHVSAAEYSNKHIGTAFIPGQKPRYIYVSKIPEGLPPTKAIALEEHRNPPEGFKYDWEMIIEHELRGKLEDILNIVGIHWKQLHYRDLSTWIKPKTQ